MVDCKVNHWLQNAFEQAEKKTRPEVKNKALQMEIIKSLRLHQTPRATALANQLEQELHQD